MAFYGFLWRLMAYFGCVKALFLNLRSGFATLPHSQKYA
jgi:hypothetical protein